jgi:hypothetical protein
MCHLKQIARLVLAAGLLCALLPGPRRAWAGDDVVTDRGGVPRQTPELVNRVAVPLANNNQPSLVDQWLFPRVQTPVVRARFQPSLGLQLAELKRCCGLNDNQEKKLSLAMTGDVTQFFDDVDRQREKFSNIQNNGQLAFANAGIGGGNGQDNPLNELSKLQAKYSSLSLCGAGSFFEKVLLQTLDAEQMAKYRKVVEERQRFRYRTAVAVTLLELEEAVPLEQKQHELLRQYLNDEAPSAKTNSYSDLCLFARHRFTLLTKAKATAAFDERQWNALVPIRQHFGTRVILLQ